MAIETTADQLKGELLQRRAALLDELERVNAGLAAIDGLRGVGTVNLVGDNWGHLGIVESAKRLLKETGQPMTTRELAEEMVRRGVKTKSKRFSATVYVVLRESPHFAFDSNIEKWSLKEEMPK